MRGLQSSDDRAADRDLPLLGRGAGDAYLDRLKEGGDGPGHRGVVPVPHEIYLLAVADADGRLRVFLLLPFFFFCPHRDHGAREIKPAAKLRRLRFWGCRRGRRILRSRAALAASLSRCFVLDVTNADAFTASRG